MFPLERPKRAGLADALLSQAVTNRAPLDARRLFGLNVYVLVMGGCSVAR